MAYFPFFVDITGRPGLIIGGGTVALRKVEKLLPYGPVLTVVAERFCPDLAEMEGIIRIPRPFRATDVEGMAFVIAATDSREVNHKAAEICGRHNILVNVVDDREACGFLFPALVSRGTLSVGISTGGASPTAAIWLKEQIDHLLPENFGQTLRWLDSWRKELRQALPGELRRTRAFQALFRKCLDRGGPCSEAEVRNVVAEYQQMEEHHG